MISVERHEQLREEAVVQSGVLRRARDPELASIVAFTAAKYRMPFGGLSIISGRRQVLIASFGTDIVETPREASFCQFTIQRPGEPLIVPDAMADPRFAALPTVTGVPAVRFYAGVSVLDRNGYALGALCIADHTPHPAAFDPTDLMIRAHEVERILRW